MVTVTEALYATEVVGDARIDELTTTYPVSWRRQFRFAVVAGDAIAALSGLVAVTALTTLNGWAAGIAAGWFVVSLLHNDAAPRTFRSIVDQLSSVLRIGVIAVAIAAFVAVAGSVETLRTPVAVGLPITIAVACFARLVIHSAVGIARRRGRCMHRAILVGSEEEVLDLVGRMTRDHSLGLKPVAACIPAAGTSNHSLVRRRVPVAGDVWDAPAQAARYDADVVVIGSGYGIDSALVRRLTWRLEETNTDVVVAPPITETFRTRVSMHTLRSAPVLHITQRGGGPIARLLKDVTERVIAAIALLVLSPLFAVIAAAVAFTSEGPTFYRHKRVGRHGTTFMLTKFRTMVVDADAQRHELGHLNVRSEGLLFKIPKDPRVTRVGAWLRRTSLDELPQLIHVVTGKMSLVGPRPPLVSEAERYTDDERRRLLVKPGLTGLWQVSGRSDLTWDESVRLDLRYVENWSLGLDLAILARTGFAVLRGRGAY
jgi:exopolysaccharide biosynthesis polyprenyl glycosylphosphotransferase